MATKQPNWKLAHTLGDIGNIYVDATGVYEPEAEIFETCDDDDSERVTIYRFALERKSLHKLPCGRLAVIPRDFDKRTDLPYPVETYEEWYSRDLDAVAQSAGRSRDDIAIALCSADVLERFNAYWDIAGHYGLDNFDSYPTERAADDC